MGFCRIQMTQERISELEDNPIEIISSEEQRKKMGEKNE